MSKINYDQIKSGSKVKVYNISSKRMRTLEVHCILPDGRLELLNCQRIKKEEIESVVKY